MAALNFEYRRAYRGGDPTSKRVGREAAHSKSALSGSRESVRTSRNNGFQDVWKEPRCQSGVRERVNEPVSGLLYSDDLC
ncbi:hypothetical protein MRX96_013091 [Rhipicephalus microplus]